MRGDLGGNSGQATWGLIGNCRGERSIFTWPLGLCDDQVEMAGWFKEGFVDPVHSEKLIGLNMEICMVGGGGV